MTCRHCWETVCVDKLPYRWIYTETCLACHASRKVVAWDDGSIEYVHNLYEVDRMSDFSEAVRAAVGTDWRSTREIC